MLNSIKNTLKDFLQFLKFPTDKQDPIQTRTHKVKRLFTLLILDIPLMGLLSILVNFFNERGWVKIENHQITLLLELFPIWMVLVLTIIIIPFIEEIIFRLFLKYKRNYLLKAIASVFNQKTINKTDNLIVNFWNKRYFAFFYGSAILFGIIHITNYDSQSTIIYLLPILILPQFILALFIGYLRVRYNFMLGYLMHALHNAFFMTIALMSISPSVIKTDINNSDYSLKIEEVTRSKNETINYAEDSIQFIGTDLKTVLSVLTKKDEDLLTSDKNLLNKKITLNFRKTPNFSVNNDSLILNHLTKVYNYNLAIKHRTQKVYTFYVKDTLQLEPHYTKSNIEISNTIISAKDLLFKNITLEQLAIELSKNYGIRFESQYPFSQKLNLKLPNSDFSNLRTVLSTKYGINLKEDEKIIEYLDITEIK